LGQDFCRHRHAILEPGYVNLYGRDITNAASGRSLRESEERYRSLFNGMTEGFALHEIICDDKANL